MPDAGARWIPHRLRRQQFAAGLDLKRHRQRIEYYPQNVGWTNSTATFTATVVNDSNNKGVTWAVTTANGGTIASADPTHGTYTPPTIAAGLPTNVIITATSVADTSKTGIASIALNPTTVPVNGGYTVTVTASETGATSQTANVTLVVQ